MCQCGYTLRVTSQTPRVLVDRQHFLAIVTSSNKGKFRSGPISAFVDILTLSRSKRVNCKIYKQIKAVMFELRCKWFLNISSSNHDMMFKKDFS